MERSRFKDQRCVTKARFGFLKWIQPDSNHIQSNDVPTQSPNSSKLGRFLQAATCRSYEQIKDRCFHKVWQVSFSQNQLFPQTWPWTGSFSAKNTKHGASGTAGSGGTAGAPPVLMAGLDGYKKKVREARMGWSWGERTERGSALSS